MDHPQERIIEQFRQESLCQDDLNRTTSVAGTRRDIQLPGRTIHTVFYPAQRRAAPIIFAYHGGGFVFGGCALDDELHQTISSELSANLVSVGYRKGEQNPFPTAVNDAYDTVKYYLEHLADEYDVDSDRVATFGSSAGANLAVTTSILAHRRKEFSVGMQILNYPFLDLVTDPEKKGYAGDDLVRVHYFNDAYAEPEQRSDPLASPILAVDEDIDREMRAIVTLADVDPLRTEGQSYAQRLRGLGLDVAEYVAAGQGHAYLELAFRDLSRGYVPPLVEAAAENGSLYAQRDATVQFIKTHWEAWLAT